MLSLTLPDYCYFGMVDQGFAPTFSLNVHKTPNCKMLKTNFINFL